MNALAYLVGVQNQTQNISLSEVTHKMKIKNWNPVFFFKSSKQVMENGKQTMQIK